MGYLLVIGLSFIVIILILLLLFPINLSIYIDNDKRLYYRVRILLLFKILTINLVNTDNKLSISYKIMGINIINITPKKYVHANKDINVPAHNIFKLILKIYNSFCEYNDKETIIELLKKLINNLRSSITIVKSKVYLEIGFSEPHITGYVMAIYSCLYPIHDSISFKANFDNELMKINTQLNTRISILKIILSFITFLSEEQVKEFCKIIKLRSV